MIGFVAIDRILGQGALSPGIYATNSMDIQVDIEVDEATTLNLIWMASALEIFLTIVPGTDAKRLEADDFER